MGQKEALVRGARGGSGLGHAKPEEAGSRVRMAAGHLTWSSQPGSSLQEDVCHGLEPTCTARLHRWPSWAEWQVGEAPHGRTTSPSNPLPGR